MFGADPVIGTVNPAFQHGPERLDTVGVGLAFHILAKAVADRLTIQSLVRPAIVRIDLRSGFDPAFDEPFLTYARATSIYLQVKSGVSGQVLRTISEHDLGVMDVFMALTQRGTLVLLNKTERPFLGPNHEKCGLTSTSTAATWPCLTIAPMTVVIQGGLLNNARPAPPVFTDRYHGSASTQRHRGVNLLHSNQHDCLPCCGHSCGAVAWIQRAQPHPIASVLQECVQGSGQSFQSRKNGRHE